MAIELKEVIHRAETDMKLFRRLTKGSYVDIIEKAKEGKQFTVSMSMHDAIKMRRVFQYHHLSNVMHQRVLQTGNVEVSFNI